MQGSRHSEKARLFLYGTLRDADANMVHKIKQVVDRVADKVRTHSSSLAMLRYMDHTFEQRQCFFVMTLTGSVSVLLV